METLFHAGNIDDILIYFLTFAFSSLMIYEGLNLLKKKKIGLFLIIAGVLLPSILAGIRYKVGVDYTAYLGMYNNVIAGRPMYWRQIEPVSALIITLSAYLRNSFLMFFLFSLITNSCFFLAFYRLFKTKNKQIALGFFIYLCILFPTTLNAIRSSVSLSLVALAFSYLIQKWSKKSLLKSALILLAASLFHKSILLVLVFIPVFWIAQKQTNNKFGKIALWVFYLAIAAAFPLIYFSMNNILPLGEYSRYLNEFNISSYSIPIANMIMSLPILYALIYVHKNKKRIEDPQLKSTLYCATFYIPLSIFVGWIALSSDGLSRVSFLLEPIIIFLAIYLISFTKNLTKFWKTISIICFILFLNAMFIRNLNWSKALPYKTIFQKESYYASEN